jgi:hypothetical protein
MPITLDLGEIIEVILDILWIINCLVINWCILGWDSRVNIL